MKFLQEWKTTFNQSFANVKATFCADWKWNPDSLTKETSRFNSLTVVFSRPQSAIPGFDFAPGYNSLPSVHSHRGSHSCSFGRTPLSDPSHSWDNNYDNCLKFDCAPFNSDFFDPDHGHWIWYSIICLNFLVKVPCLQYHDLVLQLLYFFLKLRDPIILLLHLLLPQACVGVAGKQREVRGNLKPNI